jgi:hypothetical protein
MFWNVSVTFWAPVSVLAELDAAGLPDGEALLALLFDPHAAKLSVSALAVNTVATFLKFFAIVYIPLASSILIMVHLYIV